MKLTHQTQISRHIYACICIYIFFRGVIRIFVLHLCIIIKSEICLISHCLWLVHETMVCAVVWITMLLWVCDMANCFGEHFMSWWLCLKCDPLTLTYNKVPCQVHYWRLAPIWWRHEMETFSALLAICAGNSPVTGEFPAERPVTRTFDVFFDLHLNKRLSKQWWGWWFEMPPRSLWRHCNEQMCFH